jgi:signal transduction histidine kinase
VPNQSAGQLKFSRYYRQFSSNYAFSKETLLALSIPMVAANLILDFGRVPGAFWKWFLVAFLGYLTMLAVAAAVGYLYRRVRIPAPFYLPTFYLIGMTRGLTIFLVGKEFGIIDDQDIAYRILGSATYTMAMMSMFAILYSNFDRAAKSIRELEIKRLSLENRLNSMRIEISEQNSEIAGRVSGLLSPVIGDLIHRLTAAKASEIRKEVAVLRDTVENVVRPMSHSVVNTPTSLSEPVYSRSNSTLIRRLNLDTKIRLKDIFLPSMSAFMLSLIAMPSAIAIAGAVNGLTLVFAMALSALIILRLARYVFSEIELGNFFAAIVHTLAYVLIGATTLTAVYLVDHKLLDQFVSRVFILVIFFGLTFFVGQARHLHLIRANQELQDVNLELEKLNAQAKQEIWINRRRIATVLHGPIQAALYASAIRLAQAKRPSKKLIRDVTEDLSDALKELKFEQTDALPIRKVIQEIIEVWSGVCTIYSTVPKSVHQVTNKNVNAAESFAEVIREAVSNAVKHGGADEIEISAKLVGGVIDLQIVNNGKPPTEKQAITGYGTQILNELTLSWSLAKIGEKKTLFSAEIVAGV